MKKSGYEKPFRRMGSIKLPDLLSQIEEQPELWDAVTTRQDFPGTSHGDTRTIFLRGPERMEWDCIPSVDAYGAAAFPGPYASILAQLRELIPISELGRMMVVELAGGGVISEHIDEGAYAEHYGRFHIALTDSPMASLTVGGEQRNFAQGECWWFNHQLPHSGRNSGTTPRIHLIFDAVLEEAQVSFQETYG